jgi:hypothetical protein
MCCFHTLQERKKNIFRIHGLKKTSGRKDAFFAARIGWFGNFVLVRFGICFWDVLRTRYAIRNQTPRQNCAIF